MDFSYSYLMSNQINKMVEKYYKCWKINSQSRTQQQNLSDMLQSPFLVVCWLTKTLHLNSSQAGRYVVHGDSSLSRNTSYEIVALKLGYMKQIEIKSKPIRINMHVLM
ncbi:Hypothetical_protein [Hexamita inflata]|uniref:Hypothetical_protein n=1 Tax=Hexamita inflata TaxID=28002 RepID=A0AA86TWD8_9EUKA|nr:Hypothetical protein HINF_LOCUS18989 [Hexamita inflata]CAI9967285.1 Hypothetical protein HINF_LOCUS54930 [Hexamita inflata]